MHILEEKLFLIKGDSHQYFNWENYGVRIDVPKDTLSSEETCEISVGALVGGNFNLPENTELISAIYILASSKSLSRPVYVEIEHCAYLSIPQHSDLLRFVKVLDLDKVPYQLQKTEGGEFHFNSRYGRLVFLDSTMIGIVKSLLFKTEPVDQLDQHTASASNLRESIITEDSDILSPSRPVISHDYIDFFKQIKLCLSSSTNNETTIAEIRKLQSKFCTY